MHRFMLLFGPGGTPDLSPTHWARIIRRFEQWIAAHLRDGTVVSGARWSPSPPEPPTPPWLSLIIVAQSAASARFIANECPVSEVGQVQLFQLEDSFSAGSASRAPHV